MGVTIGNPAPLGLLCFGMTTMMLMYIDMGWVETEFEEMVAAYALFYGGAIQLLVGVFEILKGSSFSFAVFGSYGAFWLGWGLTVYQNHNLESEFTGDYTTGKTAWLVQWGILSFCFWVMALRKNMCLIVVLGLLVITFFVLAAATHTGNGDVKKAAGYLGMLTALGAWYTAIAELINEDHGKHLLPGLQPIIKPEQFLITCENIDKRCQYDKKTNTIFMQFRGLQVKTEQDIEEIRKGVETAFEKAHAESGADKAHVVVDYENVLIADTLASSYWKMAGDVENRFYLSAKRFHVSSFGSMGANNGNIVGMTKV